jgi:tetratricopeptide (TPR) repeat protein
MNSWHSFSPNGRWMVFSSKSRSPYTQLFLTHIDENGDDSPAILIENSTAANRAANIPEFVNIPPDGLQHIDVPAAEFYRLFDSAARLTEAGRFPEAIAEWRKALAITPDDAKAQNNAGRAYAGAGDYDQAILHWQRALQLNPRNWEAHNNLAVALARQGKLDDAIQHLRQILQSIPGYSADVHANLGRMLAQKGKPEEAITIWRRGLALDPNHVPTLKLLAWLLATHPTASVRNGDEAVKLAERAARLSPDATTLDVLAAAYAEAARFPDAVESGRRAGKLDPRSEDIRARLALYEQNLPYRSR